MLLTYPKSHVNDVVAPAAMYGVGKFAFVSVSALVMSQYFGFPAHTE